MYNVYSRKYSEGGGREITKWSSDKFHKLIFYRSHKTTRQFFNVKKTLKLYHWRNDNSSLGITKNTSRSTGKLAN